VHIVVCILYVAVCNTVCCTSVTSFLIERAKWGNGRSHSSVLNVLSFDGDAHEDGAPISVNIVNVAGVLSLILLNFNVCCIYFSCASIASSLESKLGFRIIDSVVLFAGWVKFVRYAWMCRFPQMQVYGLAEGWWTLQLQRH
jgi:hypothetical protein